MAEVMQLRPTRKKTPAAGGAQDDDDVRQVVEALNERYAFVLVGSNAAIIDKRRISETGEVEPGFIKVAAFKELHGNRYCRVVNRKGEEDWRPWSLVWLGSPERETYHGVTICPDHARVPPEYYNLWQGFSVEPRAEGSWSLLHEHMLQNVCGGDQDLFRWLFAWFAQMFQEPMHKPGTAVAMRGRQGSGKSKTGEIMGSLLMRHYRQVDTPNHTTSNFNAHLYGVVLLQADEAFWAGEKSALGRLKGMVTSEWQMMEPKGVDATRVRNMLHLLLTSNERWMVPAELDDRRWAVFDVGDGRRRDVAFFQAMDAQMDNGGRERLLYDLLNCDVSGVNLRDPPVTAALVDQKIEGLDDVAQWWYECLMRGTVETGDYAFWPDGAGIASARVYDAYLAEQKRLNSRARRSVETRVSKELRRLCPKLTSRRVMVDGGKRVPTMVFPHLWEARAAFEQLLGRCIDWPPED